MAYIITDCKGRYVMEDPMRKNQGKYLKTTYAVEATQFTYTQARRLMQSKKERLSWVREFNIVNEKTGEVMDKTQERPLSTVTGVMDNEAVDFDDSVLAEIEAEKNAILNTRAWTEGELNKYKGVLMQGMQYYDCALSDVYHAMLDERPSKEMLAEIEKTNNDLQEKRRDIKQAMAYVDAMKQAASEGWTLARLQTELQEKKFSEYNGRTDYYRRIKDMLKSDKKPQDGEQT